MALLQVKYDADSVAKQLGISRVRVLNLLKEAREEGLIQINVVPPYYNCLFLKQNLISAFGLKDAMVESVIVESEELANSFNSDVTV
jgi:deoxyribonucleoside regulator